MNSLEENIADKIAINFSEFLLLDLIKESNRVAKEIFSIIRSSKSEECDSEYSGMDAESNCTCVCHKKTNSEEWRKENEPYCRLCNGSGTIYRKLSNKEFVEWAKIAHDALLGIEWSNQTEAQSYRAKFALTLPSGERIVEGEK